MMLETRNVSIKKHAWYINSSPRVINELVHTSPSMNSRVSIDSFTVVAILDWLIDLTIMSQAKAQV